MEKRFLASILLVLLLVTSFTESANAQFWKRKRRHTFHQVYKNDSLHNEALPWHKEENKRELKHRQKEREREIRKKRNREKHLLRRIEPKPREKRQEQRRVRAGKIARKKTIVYPLTIKKTHYRIDVLAPIYIDEIAKKNGFTNRRKIPEKAITGLSFYEGVMIAADSLKKERYDLDIFIHDVSSKNECPDSLILHKKMDSSDLVIGAVLPQDLQLLSGYCQKKNINFVSALSPADGGVRANKLFTIVQPTLKTHCEYLVKELAREYKGKKISFLYRTSVPAEDNAYNYIRADSSVKINFHELQCNTLPGKKELGPVFDTAKMQIVLVSILDNVYADSILKALNHNFPKTHFEIYGMPSWTGLGLQKKPNIYPNMSITITVPFNFDPASPTSQYVENIYTNTYNGKPHELVYRGFETLMWYGNLLRKYGTIFNDKYADTKAAPFTKFEVVPQWDKKGKLLYNENKHIYKMRYEEGAVIDK